MEIADNKSSDNKSARIMFAGKGHAPKYQSGNPLAHKLVTNFLQALLNLVQRAGVREIHEVGCGEGHIAVMLAANGYQVRGCDIAEDSLQVAAAQASKHGLCVPLQIKSIYDLSPQDDSAQMVICCEVLEHLTDPEAGLQKLAAVARQDLIVSVPNEPLWHILNMARGKYLNALGNTPGHFQHWTPRQFVKLVERYADIVSVNKPLPWTLIHCRPRHEVI